MEWTNSHTLLRRARRSLPGGVSSPLRATFPQLLYFADGSGSTLTDVDGNTYIDYALAWGPLILGHRHPSLVEAVRSQADRPHILGAQHADEILVAEQIVELVPCAARVTFTSSGSEAVQLAVRIARAATGRNRILKFEGHYHGWIDPLLVSYHPGLAAAGPREAPQAVAPSLGQSARVAGDVCVAPWNDLDAVEAAFRRYPGEIAAAIMEPVLCNSGCLEPQPGYLAGVQDICRDHGALLVFDEIITGFRIGLGGAQGHFGVVPDLATFGKALAGGLPLSVVAGRADLMDLVGSGVAFGGTFNGNPLSLAGARATLTELAVAGGAPLVRANRLGRKLMEGLRQAAAKHDLPVTVCGFGAACSLHFTHRRQLTEYRHTLDDNAGQLEGFLRGMLEEGVYLLPDGRLYVSTAHTDGDIARTLRAAERALRRL